MSLSFGRLPLLMHPDGLRGVISFCGADGTPLALVCITKLMQGFTAMPPVTVCSAHAGHKTENRRLFF
jgi:hypothetical protein